MDQFQFWKTDITYLKKVGPERAKLLASECGIQNYGDLLHFFPRKYVDRSKVYKIREITPALDDVTLVGRITDLEIKRGKKGKFMVADFTDGSGTIELTWYSRLDWIQKQVKPNVELVVFGNPRFFGRKITISHPELDQPVNGQPPPEKLSILPFYPSTEKLNKGGLHSKGMRVLVRQLLKISDFDLRENLSPDILSTYRLMGRKEALHNIHFPQSFEKLREARNRLKFEEFFFFQLMQAQKKLVQQPQHPSRPFPVVGKLFNTFFHEHLPFELTGAQKRVLKEIRRDLAQNYQMNRLVQGDVGCGKTMVAFMTILIALDNGFQATMMAPTEILAEQHYQNFLRYAEPLGIKVALIVGKQKRSERKPILDALQKGEINIAVGTHALIEDTVQFKNLGLAIVDEQHKFGVMQRARLWKRDAFYPHSMVMTATPIPRTLGMTLYGDLDVSVIDELPPGRTPVKTVVKSEAQRLEVFGFMKKQLALGRQVYVVYPLVEESEKLDYLDVTEGYNSITRAFQGIHVGIVHGRMKPEAKDYEMQRFKRAETRILVSTTVIEVGVDVPNATVMVIENSEKFGLSQLHQLRGRVGRGGNQSYCILMTGKKVSEDGKKRLKAMRSTTDGFKIAEYDLQLRGPGDFLGTRQSGMPEFKIANILEDSPILVQAREAAFQLMEKDPDLADPSRAPLKAYFDFYHRQSHWVSGVA